MKSISLRVLFVLLLVAAVAAAVGWFGRPKPVLVLTQDVARGKVEATITNTRAGTVEACQRTRLSTIVGGRIDYLGVKEGDRVEKGQLLLKLWNDDQRAQETVTASQLELAKKRVVEACTVAASAAREAQRNSGLKERGFISDSRLDQVKSEADTRAAACESVRADVRQAEARLAASRVEQRRVVLVAPFAGTVAKIVGELGEFSTPSPPGVPTPPAIDLIDDSCLYVKAPMDEVDAPKIAPGQPVRISLDALPGKSFAGRVRRVAPYVSAVEKQARTVDIEVDFEQPAEAGKLLVGYSADVEIILAGRADVLRVPTAAIQEGGKLLVLVDGRLEERKIKTGLTNWEYSEVQAGLAAGERIVTSLERAGVKAGVRAQQDPKQSESPAGK